MSDEALDEEGMFSALSIGLVDAIEAHLVSWTVRSVETRATEAGLVVDSRIREAATDAGERCRREISEQLRELVSTDIDEQRTTPLVIIRDGVGYATQVLQSLGIPPVTRDEFEQRSFPSDIYGLSPASLSDIDDSLSDIGIAWGAAKAHIFKRRHQQR